MKVKIIECKTYSTIYYKVKWKKFLFWRKIVDAYGFEVEFNSLKEAKEIASTILYKDSERVVFEMEE